MRANQSALYQRTAVAIRLWCDKQGMKPTCQLSHVHPRCYVVARVASSCIIVAVPECDREPHMQKMGYSQCDWIRKFDPALEQGDWCSTAYVSCPCNQEQVAIRVVA